MAKLVEIQYPCKFDGTMQPAMVMPADGDGPRPLLVALHTWSFTYNASCKDYEDICRTHGWHLIHPHFRGPNWTPDGCGSDLVVSDLEDAVSYMKANYNVDSSRVYLTGGSGGGHCTLLMAGRRPDLWTAVSAWCPISDIARWQTESEARGSDYGKHIVAACGGVPAEDTTAMREARLRSPVTWMRNAAKLPVDINTGIHDGHTGSVPVGQAIRAYNELALPQDRVPEEDISFIEQNEKIPAHLATKEGDPSYGTHTVYLRLQSNNVRLTLFEGGHDNIPTAAADWLERQVRGQKPDWKPGKASSADASELTR